MKYRLSFFCSITTHSKHGRLIIATTLWNSRTLGQSSVKLPYSFWRMDIGGWMWGGAEDKMLLKRYGIVRRRHNHAGYRAGIRLWQKRRAARPGHARHSPRQIPDTHQIRHELGNHPGRFCIRYGQDNNGKPLKVYKYSSRDRVLKECEDSLRRLRTDYIDLLQIHWPDITTPIAETMDGRGHTYKARQSTRGRRL